MYACGVTIAGLMNLKKKNPPIKEHIEASVASGYFLYSISLLQSLRIYGRTLVKDLICLQIHRIPYGTVSIPSIIVAKNVLAISINIVNRGTIMACTSALAAATSGGTPLGNEGGKVPVSSSIC
jgi:hypothetical protein